MLELAGCWCYDACWKRGLAVVPSSQFNAHWKKLEQAVPQRSLPWGSQVGITSWVALAIMMLTGCLLAKDFVLDAAIARGLGTPINGFPGLICIGLAFAAPIEAAFLLALLPLSFPRRAILASAWMGLVMFFLYLGTWAHPGQDSPALFTPRFQTNLPLFSLGWYLPLGLMRRLRGWQFEFAESSSTVSREPLTITGLMAFTFVVALGLMAVQLAPYASYSAAVAGMVAGIGLGGVSILIIALIMRSPPIVSAFLLPLLAAGVFYGVYFSLRYAGAGPLATTNAVILTIWFGSLFSAFVAAKLSGIGLVSLPGSRSPDA